VPIYEYECDACHFHFERRQRFDEEPIVMCPECQGKARRVIHSVPVIFKGSGFYTTDNRKRNAIEKAEEEPSGKGKEEEPSGKGK